MDGMAHVHKSVSLDSWPPCGLRLLTYHERPSPLRAGQATAVVECPVSQQVAGQLHCVPSLLAGRDHLSPLDLTLTLHFLAACPASANATIYHCVHISLSLTKGLILQ